MYAIDSRNKGCIFKDGSGFHLKKKKKAKRNFALKALNQARFMWRRTKEHQTVNNAENTAHSNTQKENEKRRNCTSIELTQRA